VIITKKKPYTKEEIGKLSEEFETYIKTVIDIDKKICCAGANRHFENEAILLKDGSSKKVFGAVASTLRHSQSTTIQ